MQANHGKTFAASGSWVRQEGGGTFGERIMSVACGPRSPTLSGIATLAGKDLKNRFRRRSLRASIKMHSRLDYTPGVITCFLLAA